MMSWNYMMSNYMMSWNWCKIYNAQKQKLPQKLSRNCIIKKNEIKAKKFCKIKMNFQRKNHKLEINNKDPEYI